MSIETSVNSGSISKIEALGSLLDSVRTSVARGLDWFVPKYTPVPPDTYSSEEKLCGRVFWTQAYHDELWNKVKDINFSEK